MDRMIVTNTQPPVGKVQTPLIRHLDIVGDGSGAKNANGDYSGAEERFLIAPAAGEIMRLARMLVTIEDTAGFRAERYGSFAAALANGIHLKFVRDGVDILTYTDGHAIQTNAEWGHFCYDVDLKTWGAGDEFVIARWTFAATGTCIRLVGDALESFDVVLNDDLTGLLGHHFVVQGLYE